MEERGGGRGMDHEKGRDAMKGEGGVMSVGKLISAGKTREPAGGKDKMFQGNCCTVNSRKKDKF